MIQQQHKRFFISARFIVLALAICIFRTWQLLHLPQHRMRVVIPSYNNAAWCEKNLDSAVTQRYNNFDIVYIDDASTDSTYDLVRVIASRHSHIKINVCHNQQRLGALANHVRAFRATPGNTIIISLDGDDWFADEHVLADLNTLYHLTGCWMTYGQFQNWPTGQMGWCAHIPHNIVRAHAYREFGFVTAQTRTYFAWLAQLIHDEDLRDNDGQYYTTAGDVALMMPMLEMSGGRFVFAHRVTCIRNVETELNDFKLRAAQQKAVTREIRNKQKYEPLPCKRGGINSTP